MAEPVVAFVAEKLYNLVIEEATFVHGIHDQVEEMQMELRQMRAFLQVAESNPTEDERVTNIVEDVRRAAYDAEDIVDTYILMMHRRRRGFVGFIKKSACILPECVGRHNIGMQIERINASLQKISETRSRYGIDNVTGGTQDTFSHIDSIMQEQRALAIQREMNVTVGFEDEMEEIVETLLDINEKPRRCVVSIVGMGGAGKSTLARRICNRADVMRSFDGCTLVTVSQTWNLHKILEDIAAKFSGLDGQTIQNMDERDLKEKVFTSLHGKRYLIVLDDMWETDVWRLVGPHLPDEQNGSRVMITSRSMNVARFADPSTESHQLRLLREDESWELFIKIVFPGHGEDAEKVCTGELKYLVKKILKNCGGLPLAIVLMGGLLSTREKTPMAWEDVLEGISWEEVPGGQVFSKVLGLSYRDLPHHLKPCFLYLSHFPEDFVIEADKLIRLWVAEGFVPDQVDRQRGKQSSHRTMEETARGWLEDLVRRCLVQVVERAPSGTLMKCQMHDVLRDLSTKEAGKANFFHTWQQVASVSPPSMTRRLVLHQGARDERAFRELCAPKLRTFLVFLREGLSSPQFVMSLKLLRVLDLEGSNCHELPKAIGDLIHLRYLGLRWCRALQSIPTSVGNLQNLQTFDVYGTPLKQVPDCVWGIRTLRHVFIENNVRPRINVGGGSSQLVNLQTLVRAGAGSWMESILATSTSLRMLAIMDISQSHQRAISDSLDSLVHLRHLFLSTSNTRDLLLPRKALALPNHRRLQNLILRGRLMPVDDLAKDNSSVNYPALYASDEMPPNLIELELSWSGLRQDPFLLLGKLPYLKRLRLCGGAYEGEEAVCSAGGFPQLEELELKKELCLRWWMVEDGALPRLRRLRISACKRLEMLPDGLQHLKTLQTLEIQYMPDEFMRRLQQKNAATCTSLKYSLLVMPTDVN